MTEIQAIKQYSDNNGPWRVRAYHSTIKLSERRDRQSAKHRFADYRSGGAQWRGLAAGRPQSKQLASTKTQATQFVSDIEDADLPTALTNLQQDQLQLQAAARMAANIGKMSLLNFLPAG